MFILPKVVIKEVDKRCRNFLWKGNAEASFKGTVARDCICKPKQEGGLGIKDIFIWNKATAGRQIWEIVSSKSSLWAHLDH